MTRNTPKSDEAAQPGEGSNNTEGVTPREGVTTDRAAEAQLYAARNTSAPPLDDDAVVIKADGAVSDFEDAHSEQFVTLTANVYEEFYFPDTKRPSYRLLFTKGQVIRKSVIEALNARVNADKLAEANPARTDTSTLASGTHPGIQAVKDAVGE